MTAIHETVIKAGKIDNASIGQSTPAKGGFTQIQWDKGADVASANALILGADGNYFDITGTTAITSIGTLGVGALVCLHFDGILTFTHNATNLILPGGANITTAAGDEAILIEYDTGKWRCIAYNKASGRPISSYSAPVTITDDDVSLTSAHFGKTVRMDSAGDRVATFPSLGASDDGAKGRIAKVGAGKVTVTASDSDKINKSGAGCSIYNDEAAETWAYIDYEYVHAKETIMVSGNGTWTTTN